MPRTRDPDRTRKRWLGVAVLSSLVAVMLFAANGWRTRVARVCTDTALTDVWSATRRDALATSLQQDGLSKKLDQYAAAWTTAQKTTCLDHRRRTLTDAQFDERTRCLELHRQAFASTVDVLLTGTPPDPARIILALPPPSRCDPPGPTHTESTAPVTTTIKNLEARLISARTSHIAGDAAGALAQTEAILREARDQALRPILAEALLLRARLRAALLKDLPAAREDLVEATLHAIASHRDALAAESITEQILVDARSKNTDAALAAVPLARALAERLPAPAVALARLEHALGAIDELARHDRDAAHAHYLRAATDLARTPDADPLELSKFLHDQASTTRDPEERRTTLARADALLTEF